MEKTGNIWHLVAGTYSLLLRASKRWQHSGLRDLLDSCAHAWHMQVPPYKGLVDLHSRPLGDNHDGLNTKAPLPSVLAPLCPQDTCTSLREGLLPEGSAGSPLTKPPVWLLLQLLALWESPASSFQPLFLVSFPLALWYSVPSPPTLCSSQLAHTLIYDLLLLFPPFQGNTGPGWAGWGSPLHLHFSSTPAPKVGQGSGRVP